MDETIRLPETQLSHSGQQRWPVNSLQNVGCRTPTAAGRGAPVRNWHWGTLRKLIKAIHLKQYQCEHKFWSYSGLFLWPCDAYVLKTLFTISQQCICTSA
jgi:hypothetical protein